ncbi:MAG: amidohydrolase family protein [Planctomycetaceae bacterium]|nr:amidohydrolase family protein [Planctomycetaceae bacterium]
MDAPINRRELICSLAKAGIISPSLTAALAQPTAQCFVSQDDSITVIDTNVSLFQWPFRRLPLEPTAVLAAKLRQLNITEAWAGSFEGIFHRDLTSANDRLAAECLPFQEFRPVGTINPMLPGWKFDLERCVRHHRMSGIRLFPGYHGYAFDATSVGQLLEMATAFNVFIQIVVSIEDTRTQPEMLRIPDADLTALPDVIASLPTARLQILNHKLRDPLLSRLSDHPGVYFDTARLEGTDSIPELCSKLPKQRLLFGSHAPFLIPEAALIRVHESNQLDLTQLQDIYHNNASRFLRN